MMTTRRGRILERSPEGTWFLAMLCVSVGFAVLVAIAAGDLYPSESDGPFFLAAAAGTGLFAVLAAVGATGGRIIAAIPELLDEGERTDPDRSG